MGADLVAAAWDPVAAPTTGDFVQLQNWADGRVTAEAVLPRRTAIVRASASGRSQGQVLATNVDSVAVVESLLPEPQVARVERLLALAWDSGALPHLVLTKADLCSDGDAVGAELGGQVAPGVPVHVVAAPVGLGLEGLAGLCAAGQTLALVGGSGAGKSTLLNALVGAELMATNALATIGKGRHTTVTRELHASAGGGAVIDTPGLRGVGLLDTGGLAAVFPEVEGLAGQCRFGDCAHEGEPGCAVVAAVEAGELPESPGRAVAQAAARGPVGRLADRRPAPQGARAGVEGHQQGGPSRPDPSLRPRRAQGANELDPLCGDRLLSCRTPGVGRPVAGCRADVAQLVEHHLAKVRVAGSNPVVRSEGRETPHGGVAERRGNGLQSRVHGFKSRLHLDAWRGRLAQR